MLKKIKNLINSIMIVVTFIMIIYFIINNMYDRLVSCFCLYVLIFVPHIFDKKGYKIKETPKFIYILYIYLSLFWGSIINLYKTVWFYDLFIHFLSGFLLIIYIILIKNNHKKSSNKFTYYMGFITFMTIIWCIPEFIFELITKSNIPYMKNDIFDIVKNFLASIVGSILGYILMLQERK